MSFSDLLSRILSWRIDAALLALCGAGAMLVLWIQCRRMRASARLANLATVAIAVLVGAGIHLAEGAGEDAKVGLRRTIEGLAPTYAAETRLLRVQKVTLDTPPTDPTYLAIIEAQKRWQRANPNIADVYVFARRADGKIVLLVDSETDYDHDGIFSGEREERTPIGEVYDEEDAMLEQAFAGQRTFHEAPVTDRWGTWMSAFEPILDDQGRVHSVLGVDYPATGWNAAVLRARAFVLILMGCMLLVVTGGTSFAFVFAAKARSEAAGSERSRFLAHMSHEIRTPMNAILGYAQLLSDDDLTDEERLEHTATIRRCGEHLLSLLNSVLDMAKLESGQMQVERIAFDLRGLCEDVLAIARPLAAAKSLQLEFARAQDLPSCVRSDPGKLRQILLNLLGNAVKFTPRGTVRLTVTLETAGAATPTGWVRFTITDTGIGIDRAALARLFKPFVQADASVARVHGGTGLGLAISLHTARLLGGTLVATSTLGRGSTFTLRVPLERADHADAAVSGGGSQGSGTHAFGAVPAEPAPEPAEPAPTSAIRVLLVEDGKDNQRLVRSVLTKAGMHVEIVENGAECLTRVFDTNGPRPDVILMDVQMPVMDGRTATQKLRAAGIAIPIIAITAHAIDQERALCLAAGADDFMGKPIELRHLVATVRRIAGAPQA